MLYNADKMLKDLEVINEEIERLMERQPSMDKYQRLGVLIVCKDYLEKEVKTKGTTVTEIIDDKMEQIGARATLLKIEPILSKLVKDIEMIAPTISGQFIKQLKEM